MLRPYIQYLVKLIVFVTRLLQDVLVEEATEGVRLFYKLSALEVGYLEEVR